MFNWLRLLAALVVAGPKTDMVHFGRCQHTILQQPGAEKTAANTVFYFAGMLQLPFSSYLNTLI
jgi:hypothetical protein